MLEIAVPRNPICCYFPGASQHVLIYLHGIQSHSQWLVPSAEELSRRGISVYVPERRGSGRFPSPRGDIQSYQDLLEDVKALLRFVREKEPGKSIHLAGLCWGARLALPVALDATLSLASVVLISPGLYLKVDYPWTQKCSIAGAFLTAPQKRFALPLRDEWFTHNPFYLDFIRQDGLGLREVTARFLRETLRLNRLAQRAFKTLSLPVLVLLAEKDKIVDVQKTVEAFRFVAAPQRQLKVYPGWHHSLEFESENKLFYDDLMAWLQAQAPSPS